MTEDQSYQIDLLNWFPICVWFVRVIECSWGRDKGDSFIWYQSYIRAMVETRASQIVVLEKNMERFQKQVDDHTGSIERLHLKVDGLEAGVAEIRAMMQEVMKRLPVVEQPAVQPRQEE